MSIYNLESIQTIFTKDNLLSYKKKVEIVDEKLSIEKGLGSNTIYINNVQISEEEVIPLRELTKTVKIELLPVQNFDDIIEELRSVVNLNEDPNQVLILRSYLECPESKWCSEPVETSIEDSKEKIIEFTLNVNDVVGKILITNEYVRTKGSNLTNKPIATSKDSIVGSNSQITIFVDDPPEIGSDFFPIKDDNLEKLLFDIKDFENPAVNLPALYYHSDFKRYFESEKFESVKLILSGILPLYIDFVLKKYFASGKADGSDEDVQAVIKFVAEVCDVSPSVLFEQINESDAEDRFTRYAEYSIKLFRGIQTHNNNSYKTLYKSIIKKEQAT